MNQFTDFERAVLDWICTHNANTTLAAQLKTAQFRKREQRVDGSLFVHFDVDHSLPKSDLLKGKQKWPLDGPVVYTSEIDGPASVIVWGNKEDYANGFEVLCYRGDRFPEAITTFDLFAFEEICKFKAVSSDDRDDRLIYNAVLIILAILSFFFFLFRK